MVDCFILLNETKNKNAAARIKFKQEINTSIFLPFWQAAAYVSNRRQLLCGASVTISIVGHKIYIHPMEYEKYCIARLDSMRQAARSYKSIDSIRQWHRLKSYNHNIHTWTTTRRKNCNFFNAKMEFYVEEMAGGEGIRYGGINKTRGENAIEIETSGDLKYVAEGAATG